MAQKLTAAQRRSLRGEARQWDELDDREVVRLFDEGRPVRVRLRRPAPRAFTVALDEPTLNRLKRLARRKQIGAKQLAAMWIAERLAGERAADKPRRVA